MKTVSPTLFGRISAPFREFGWSAGLLYALDRVLRRLSPRMAIFAYEFMVQPIPEKALLPASLSRNLVFRQIRRGDPEIALMPARPGIKESRFEQGAVCVGAFRNEVLIGYIWLCFDQYEEDEVRCTYRLARPAESVFDFDLFVFPKYRMGIGFAAVWDGASEYLRARGIRFSFSRLTRFNLASRRSHDRLGWKRVAKAVFVTAWSAEFMFANTAPFISFTLRPRRVRLLLHPTVLEAHR